MNSARLKMAFVGFIVTGIFIPNAMAAEACRVRLAVETFAEPGIPSAMMRAGAAVLARVYRQFGVTIEFMDDAPMPAPSTISRRRIVIERSATKADPEAFDAGRVLGLAPRNGDTPGRVAYVFYDAVMNAARRHDLPPGSLMGYAMAHELGHLLLPAGHGASGVMGNDWEKRVWIQIRAGVLAMGDREAALICRYLDSGWESR
jgi:hypothetical protein